MAELIVRAAGAAGRSAAASDRCALPRLPQRSRFGEDALSRVEATMVAKDMAHSPLQLLPALLRCSTVDEGAARGALRLKCPACH